MADHTAAYAAFSTVSVAFRILTLAFKINFFKPAVGDALVCRSRIIQGGRTIIVSEFEEFDRCGDTEKRVSKTMVTLMVVPVKVSP